MAVTNGWGQGVINNTIGFGKGSTNATNGWGEIYEDSPSGDTAIEGASFTNVYSTEFDGVDDYILLDSNTQNFSDFSLSFWVIRGGGHYKSIVGAETSSSGGILKGIVVYGGAIKYSDTTTGWTALTGALSNTVWNHVFITYESSSNTLKGYQDGSLITTINPTFSGASTNAHSIRYIGARYGTGYFNELLDEVALWDSIKNIGDVWDGSGSATDLTSTNPVHWWRFEEGSGTTATDSGSGGIDGTLTNGVAYSTNVP